MRKKRVVRGRRIFCQLAVGKMGHPGAEVARFLVLGVTTSSVNRLAASEETPDLRKCLKIFQNLRPLSSFFLLPIISLFLYSESGEGRDAPGDGPSIGEYSCRQWHLYSIPEGIAGREGLKFHR